MTIREAVLHALILLPALPVLGAVLAPYNTETATNGPMTAAQVAALTPLPPGFKMSVFAAEPDVQQPISMATDPAGRLWVAENYTYSESRVGYHPDLRDRILVFTDSDNDGRFDKRAVFWDAAERLTSVEVGLGGVWALALPNLVFIPDANHDGVADGPPQVILDGFEYKVGRHTVANGLRWGPDGWLYGRHGIQSTSRIGAPGTPDSARVAMNVGIWRYHPVRRVVEVVAQGTTNPWGMDWDARGEPFFINTVIGHLWHVIPGAHYRRMYGEDPTPRIYEVIEQHADHVHWATGEVWTDVRKKLTDVTLAAGGGHAHTGLLIYQGGQWPSEWNGKLLTINFHGRRINVTRLEPSGTGVVGRREPDAFPFADPWFRGIDLIAAPDGGVFVSDWSDSGECHDQEGIHRTSGRIYKITHGDVRPVAPPNLYPLGEIELARLQTSTNDWLTRQARRVLADRAKKGEELGAARAELARIATDNTQEVHRLRALWGLHVSGGVKLDMLVTRLQGSDFERCWAIRLLEDASHLQSGNKTAFESWVANELPRYASAATSGPVRLTLASLLQKLPLNQRAQAAQALLSHPEDSRDHNQPLMIWYGIEPLAGKDARFVDLIATSRNSRVQRLGARRLAEDYDTRPALVDQLLQSVAISGSVAARQSVLDGLADGFAGRRKVEVPSVWSKVQPGLEREADDRLLARIQDLGALFGDGRAVEQIREAALNEKADPARRRAALQALIDSRAPGLRSICERLLQVRELSATAAKGLAVFEDPGVADKLLAEWPNLYGHERPAVLNVLLSRPLWAGRLLEAMGNLKFRRADLGVAQARQILAYNNPGLTRLLTDNWGTIQQQDDRGREEALARWRQRLTPEKIKTGNLREGQSLYAQTCGSCHKLYGAGGNLGPELTGSGRQNLEYLLENILFPSAVVPVEFRQTTVSLKDGRSLSGVVRSRTAGKLVLEMVGETITVNRDEISTEETSPLSIMPEGLLDALAERQVIDLIAFLMSTSPPSPREDP